MTESHVRLLKTNLNSKNEQGVYILLAYLSFVTVTYIVTNAFFQGMV